MARTQFGQNVSFPLTLHTWELIVTSEVERKMILMGHPISYVIYNQLQGHLTIFKCIAWLLYFLKMDVTFFWYEYLRI
jgi:hypothetical protein